MRRDWILPRTAEILGLQVGTCHQRHGLLQLNGQLLSDDEKSKLLPDQRAEVEDFERKLKSAGHER